VDTKNSCTFQSAILIFIDIIKKFMPKNDHTNIYFFANFRMLQFYNRNIYNFL